jgi:hypothetical protein
VIGYDPLLTGKSLLDKLSEPLYDPALAHCRLTKIMEERKKWLGNAKSYHFF